MVLEFDRVQKATACCRGKSSPTTSIDNAMVLDMAMGGSTNTVLHMLAVAREAGIAYDIERINQLSRQTPNVCRVAPSSSYHVEDVHNAGGVHTILGSVARGRPGLAAFGLPHGQRQDAGREHRRLRHPRRDGRRRGPRIGGGDGRRAAAPIEGMSVAARRPRSASCRPSSWASIPRTASARWIGPSAARAGW